MKVKRSKINQSLEKTIQLVETMARGQGSMRLQDIANQCGMPPSTALRMLNTLLVHGYVLQDPITQQYALSLRFSRLGVLVRQQTDLLRLARPFLRELADRCRDTVCLIAPDGDDALCVETAPGPDGLLLVHQQAGARAPLHTSAAGKLLLLNFSNQRLNEYLNRCGQTAVTPRTITGREALLEELERTRARGYGLEYEERELGARTVSAPVRDFTGQIAAGLSMSAPTARMSARRVEDLVPLLLETAGRLSRILACDTP